jgi:hypothetical protein
MPTETRPKPQRPARRPEGRKPYRAPALTEYGSISKLTRGGGSTRTDFQGAMMRSGCL